MNAFPGARLFGALAANPASPATIELPRDILMELLDLIGLSIVLTGPSGEIVYTNKTARQLLGENTVLRQCHGRLRAICRSSSADLQSALALATGHEAFVPKHGIVVPLYDADGAVRAASWVFPLNMRRSPPRPHFAAGWLGASGEPIQHGGNPQACPGSSSREKPGGDRYAAFITRELTHETTISAEFFTRCFGITKAERRLLERLADGMTVLQAGQALGVSANTTKTHLRGLFAKTGTRRQAELMRLAATTLPPAALCGA